MHQIIPIRGVVTVTKRASNGRILGRSVHHNTITKKMAIGLISLLAGQFSGGALNMSNYIPSYLGIGGQVNQDSDEDVLDFNKTKLNQEYRGVPASQATSDLLPYRYTIVSKEPNYISDGSVTVSLRTFIAPGDLVDSYEIRELGLYSNSTGDTLLSRVEFPESIEKQAGSGIDITWNIIIAPAEDKVTVL